MRWLDNNSVQNPVQPQFDFVLHAADLGGCQVLLSAVTQQTVQS